MMRRVFFGLVLPLVACGGAFAGDVPAPSSDPGGPPAKLSGAGHLHHPKNNKRVSRAQRSLPLSSAGAYASEHPTALPDSTVPRPAPPSSKMWTGFYVGGGAGAPQP